jgi:uncharacterized repeat protein (TIGR03803 family)
MKSANSRPCRPERSFSGRPARLERVESRVLFSAYSLGELGAFGANASGAGPESALVADSAGNLYGTAHGGGAYGAGNVFEIANGSSAITTVASFNGADGSDPIAGLSLDGSGNFYGTTYNGGAYNEGTVFEIGKGSGLITTLASFNGSDGGGPSATLSLDNSGNIFGTTANGGPAYDGTLFEIATGSNAITTLVNFSSTIGSRAGMVFDSAGNLYGTFVKGGDNQVGALFEIPSGSGTPTTIASFSTTNGAYPEGDLTIDSADNIYGTTQSGGGNNNGTVFEIASGSDAITTLASFNSTVGGGPVVGPKVDASGNLYGTTESGGAANAGTVWELPQGAQTITPIVSFSSGGASPVMVMPDAAGNLYGATQGGGTHGNGTIFEIPHGSAAMVTVASFDYTDGTFPYAGLTLDSSGDAFGAGLTGGAYNDGTVVEVPKGSSTMTILASFNGTDGSLPEATPTLDASGNLIGTTQNGGTNNYGVVFEVAANSNTITALASFDAGVGQGTKSPLVVDTAGDIFGATQYGGANNDGAVYEIATGTNTITTLASFNGTNGNQPSDLVLDASGNIFGTTLRGGANSSGTVFEILKGSSTIVTVASLSSATGTSPVSLALDAAGNIYGAAEGGGTSDWGTVFEITSGSGQATALASFQISGGAPPNSVAVDAAGNVYGSANEFGPGNAGIIFEIARGSGTITDLLVFNAANGLRPNGVTLDSYGNLYGTTYEAGPSDVGTAFELAANTQIALAAADSSNTTDGSAPLNFTATIAGGAPDGENVYLEDASNKDAVVAQAALSGGAASLTIPAGTLAAGPHNLIAVYGGDANFAACESAPYVQNIQTAQVAVTGVTINGNLPLLGGPQRSMVDSIVYTFSAAVNMGANAFSIAVHAGQTGTVPSPAWAAINPNGDGSSSQWVVAFSGAGVVGGTIANGVYDISLNAAAVTSAANPAVTAQSRPTDTFYRLFGDSNGDGRVNNADYAAFLNTNGLKSGQPGFNSAFDSNGDGRINNSDYALMLTDNGLRYSGFTATI